jgi:DeoR/GlpR family transcriptional regulator of sugar metabolism
MATKAACVTRPNEKFRAWIIPALPVPITHTPRSAAFAMTARPTLPRDRAPIIIVSDWNSIVLEDAAGVQVVFLGGTLRKGYHCTVGPVGVRMVQDLRVDKAFMATNSLSLEAGATTPDLHQAETKKAMIAIARKVILLCDSSKIGRESFARFAALDRIDVIVTERIGDEDRLRFEEHGIEVLIAGGSS